MRTKLKSLLHGSMFRKSQSNPATYGLENLSPAELDRVRSIFDETYYHKRYPDIALPGIDAFDHFMNFGWKEERDPCAIFHTATYLQQVPELREKNVNPFVHWIIENKHLIKGQKTTPPPVLAFLEDFTSEQIKLIWEEFDEAYYRDRYPDVGKSTLSGFEHYMQQGWREGRDPSANFSTNYYLEVCEDVRDSGINPLTHWVFEGRKEKRRGVAALAPTKKSTTPLSGLEGFSEGKIALIRQAFDTYYYNSHYLDVVAAKVDPFEHYMNHGWKEGRDPSADFSTNFYLEQAPDVKAAGMNPLVHWVLAGKSEGRLVRHPGGIRYDLLLQQRPFSEMAREWKRELPEDIEIKSGEEVVSLVLAGKTSENSGLIISVSHDNYRRIGGGVQLCVQREEAAATAGGNTYLNIHPASPLPCLANEDDDPVMQILLNGQELCLIRMSEMIIAAKKLGPSYKTTKVIVHHMMGHVPELVSKLVAATGTRDCFVWLHDFFTICPSYALQRNNLTFCGAPDIKSNSCKICLFGKERASHQKRMQAFFASVEAKVLAPSNGAMDLWKANSKLTPASAEVLPHVKLTKKNKKANGTASEADAPKRIAFVGYPGIHKGWHTFVKLHKQLNTREGYRFVYFGSNPPPATENLQHVAVTVTAENPGAMIDALAENQIDLVLHWASCFETFSFSTIEAICAGSAVLTNAGSGNVASLVRKYDAGAVLNDEEDLLELFEDGRAEDLVSKTRDLREKQQWKADLSSMTFDVLEAKP